MPPLSVVPIDDFYWTATKYSDVLKVDRRVCQQALETIPYKLISKRRVWHIRDGAPAIFKRLWGLDSAKETTDLTKLAPKEKLDYFRAERERIKLAREVRALILSSEVEVAVSQAFKGLAQALDILPDTLERDAGLSADTVALVQRIIDKARDNLYETILRITEAPQ